MVYVGDFCFGLSKIVSAKCTPSGLIITQVTLFLLDCKGMKGDYNQGMKAKISVSKVIRTSHSWRLPEYQIKQSVEKLLLSLSVIARHHNGAIWNESLLSPVPRPHLGIIRC